MAVTIPNDEYYTQYFEKHWKGVAEPGEVKISKKEVMHLIKLMRQRLITLSNDK